MADDGAAHGGPREVIVVTDGDSTAWRAVEGASRSLGLYPLAASRGNPTRIGGRELVKRIHEAPTTPVVVMVDDQGDPHKGPGERVLEDLLEEDSIRVLGVVAVASETPHTEGIQPDVSVTRGARTTDDAVDKGGRPHGTELHGDTIDVLGRFRDRVPVVGLGDPGKMGGRDRPSVGEPATRLALETVLERGRRGGDQDGGADAKTRPTDH